MLPRALSGWGRLLGLGGSPPNEEERRAWGRLACNIETTCGPTSPGHSERLTVQVKNVSPGGICLLCSRPFRPGELIRVAIPHGEKEAVSEVLACVVRCDRQPDGSEELGCTFASSLSEQEVMRFRTPIAGNNPPEQRSWMRFPCAARAVYQLIRTPEPGDRQSATVLNISGGGVALQVSEALSVGDLLSVELRRDNRVVVTALASVVRTMVEPNGERLIGCNFIHELPEHQIADLLE